MKFRCQYVQTLDYETGEYKAIGVLVENEGTIEPIGIEQGNRSWEDQIKMEISRWEGTPKELFARLLDQNNIRTAYAQPVTIAADTPAKAADKLHARNQRDLV